MLENEVIALVHKHAYESAAAVWPALQATVNPDGMNGVVDRAAHLVGVDRAVAMTGFLRRVQATAS